MKTLDTNKLFKASCELIWLVSGFTNAINIDILFLYAFSFINAKSDISPEDVHALVELGLEIFHASQNKFVVQVMLAIYDFYMAGFDQFGFR